MAKDFTQASKKLKLEKKKTKIVCTMGPATEDDDTLRELIRNGMNVARLNFSHGSHDYHRKNIQRVRRIAARGKDQAVEQILLGDQVIWEAK
jgi:pyruvate kinase